MILIFPVVDQPPIRRERGVGTAEDDDDDDDDINLKEKIKSARIRKPTKEEIERADNDIHPAAVPDLQEENLQIDVLHWTNRLKTTSDIVEWVSVRSWPSVVVYNEETKGEWLRNKQRRGYKNHLLLFASSTEKEVVKGEKKEETKKGRKNNEFSLYRRALALACELAEWRDRLACAIVDVKDRKKFSSMRLADGFDMEDELRLVASSAKGVKRYALESLSLEEEEEEDEDDEKKRGEREGEEEDESTMVAKISLKIHEWLMKVREGNVLKM